MSVCPLLLHGKQYSKWLLLFFSSILYTLPFLYPAYCAELVFCSLSPLFFLVCNYQCSFKEGFFWGVWSFSIYFMGIALLVYEHAFGSWRLIFFCIFLIYCSIISGCLFLISQKGQKLLNNTGVTAAGVLLTSFFLYFLFIHYMLFLPLCVVEGNKLQHLLLPLAIRPQWLFCIHYCGLWPLLGCLLLINMGIGCGLWQMGTIRHTYLLCALGCFLPFASGWFLHSKNSRPDVGNLVRCFPNKSYSSPWQQAQALSSCIAQLKEPSTIILTPESTFNFAFNHYPELVPQISQQKTCFIGAQRCEESHYYNCIYKCSNGRITDYYDKNHPLFLTEYLPAPLRKITMIYDLFLHNKIQYEKTHHKKYFCWDAVHKVEPIACSELFFNKFDIKEKEAILLVFVNDTWFSADYVRNLMFLYGRLTALYTERVLIYISYFYGAIINKRGTIFEIPSYSY